MVAFINITDKEVLGKDFVTKLFFYYLIAIYSFQVNQLL